MMQIQVYEGNCLFPNKNVHTTRNMCTILYNLAEILPQLTDLIGKYSHSVRAQPNWVFLLDTAQETCSTSPSCW